jgi:hypothetical protein
LGAILFRVEHKAAVKAQRKQQDQSKQPRRRDTRAADQERLARQAIQKQSENKWQTAA